MKSTKVETCYAESLMSLWWTMSEWGACINGVQYRTLGCKELFSDQMVDISYCGKDVPESSRTCGTLDKVIVQSSSDYADVIDAANFLAGSSFIPDYSSNPAQYQLNDMITRQELLTMILKAMKLTPAPEYQCQNIFSDISDPEVCAVAETALANRLI